MGGSDFQIAIRFMVQSSNAYHKEQPNAVEANESADQARSAAEVLLRDEGLDEFFEIDSVESIAA